MQKSRMSYVELFKTRGMQSLVSGSLLARMSDIIIPTVLLLLVSQNGQLLRSGTVVAVYSLTVAAMAPAAGHYLARLVIPSNGLIWLASGQAISLVVCWATFTQSKNFLLQLATVIGVAILTPPVAALVRNGINTRFEDDQARKSYAFAVEGAISQVVVVAGTALAAVLVATVSDSALVVAGVVRIVGVVLLKFSPILPTYIQMRSSTRSDEFARTTNSGPSQGLVLTILGVSSLLTAIGTFELALIAIGHDFGSNWSSWLLTALAAASVVGALISGAISSGRKASSLLFGTCAAFAVLLVPLLIVQNRLIVLSSVAIGGLLLGAASALQLQTVGAFANQGKGIQIYSWLSTISYGSVALGNIMGGWLSQNSWTATVGVTAILGLVSGCFCLIATRPTDLT